MSRGVNRTRTTEEAGRILPGHVSKQALKAQQAERAQRALTLEANERAVKDVLELTKGLPTLNDGTILGPDGMPLLRPVIKDYAELTAEGKDPVRLYAEDILMRAARMQRDGASLRQIAVALDIAGIVPEQMLERALVRLGHPMLNAAIAAGEEPAETKVVIGYEAVDDEPEEEDVMPVITSRPVPAR